MHKIMNPQRKQLRPLKIFLTGIAMISFFSCNQSEKKYAEMGKFRVVASKVGHETDSLIVCNIASVKDFAVIPLSSLLSDLEIIQLENSDEALTKRDGHITVSENFIGIYSSSAGYKVFNKQGAYLYTLSSRGNGPNEYTIGLYDSFIDEEGGRIYLLPGMANHIFVYDLKGNIQASIPLAYRVHKGKFKVDREKKEILLTVLPFSDSPSVVWKQDFDGNIIQEIPSGHLTVMADYSNEVKAFNSPEVDFSLFHWSPVADTLYHYHEAKNVLIPMFTGTFKDEILQHDYFELPNHYLFTVTENFTTEHIGNNVMITAGKLSQILIDKQTLRGCFAGFELDMLGEIEHEWLGFNRGYFVANIYPHELIGNLSKILDNPENNFDEIRVKAERLYNSMNEDNNNIIFVGKLKQDPVEPFVQKDIYYKEATEPSTPKNSHTIKTTGTQIHEDEDEKTYGIEDLRSLKTTAYLDKFQAYFIENNKYKDWSAQDGKKVLVRCIVEKNGQTTDVTISQSCGVEELDNEALRLIREAQMVPATNLKGNHVRMRDFVIPVSFPPQK
jgi:TonB family protein